MYVRINFLREGIADVLVDPAHDLLVSFLDTPHVEQSEDCLYLNVYAPSSAAKTSGRAVMLWIYGGGLQYGTASQALYDGSAFAAYQDVVLVTINYRTNGNPLTALLRVQSLC